MVLLRQQEDDGMEEVEEGREIGSKGDEEVEEDTTVRSMLVMFEQWTVIGIKAMSLAHENGQGFPRKEQRPVRQSRSTRDPSIVRSFPSLKGYFLDFVILMKFQRMLWICKSFTCIHPQPFPSPPPV